ncbi:MAG: ParB N-terminal domain-containing protein [Proteobacteria bacterium]|nr:ParB N-terminal domain-containing protein [Pseudomonadota bacterium]MDA1057964.1 ParB N-terminal domain-containing protein [Pseudomonadota bacterium]
MPRDEINVPIADIYVPVDRRKTLNEATVAELAASILEDGQRQAIYVRHDGKRYILVEGLHRMEACKSLGETEIRVMLVQARRR